MALGERYVVEAPNPPGQAQITECPDCHGAGCADCGHRGKILWRACPRCGDISFDFANGRNDEQGMICRIGCGFAWTADDPAWLAQVLP